MLLPVAPQPGSGQAFSSKLQKLSIPQHTWHCCYHGDTFVLPSPFVFLNLGAEAGAGHS